MDPENPPHPTMIPNENINNHNLGILNEIPSQNNKIHEVDCSPTLIAEWRKISEGCKPNQKDNNVVNGIVFRRAHHCAFLYKNSIYIYGGSEVSLETGPLNSQSGQKQIIQTRSRKQSLWNSFHKFNINNREYSKQPISFGANTNMLTNISSFGHLVIGNLLFVVGGMNYDTQQRRNSEIISINLDSGSIKKYESKTSVASIPSPRINPCVSAIEKSILLVFGGEVYNNNTGTSSFLNDMYIFKIETKTWTKIEDSFHSKFPLLVRPSLINFGDNCLYLLGGKRQILHNDGSGVQEIDNFGMYKLRVINKTINSKSDCCVKQVLSTNLISKSETFLKFVKYTEKGVFAITTDSETMTNLYLWYYDVAAVAWIKVKQVNTYIDYRLTGNQEQDFIVGQEKVVTIQKNGQIFQFNFLQSQLQNSIKQALGYYNNKFCFLCQEEKATHSDQRYLIPAERFQQYCSPIQFPYAAIGLIVDNSVVTKAKVCNVVFNVASLGKQANDNNKSVYLIIEDNGSPIHLWGPQLRPADYVNKMMNFYATILSEDMMASEDNKNMMKKNLKDIQEKEKNLQKQFSQFLKNQNKANGSTNQTNFSIPNGHFKTEKDFEKEQQQYLERKQRLQFKKCAMQNEQKMKRFCTTIKLAGVSLGDSISYACKQRKNEQNSESNTSSSDKETRRYFFMRKEKCLTSGKNFYVCYAYVTQNGNVADPKMQSIAKHCSKQFRKEIKILNDRLKSMSSVYLISQLKNFCINQDQNDKNPDSQNSPIKELRFRKKQNDIFYADRATFVQFQQMNPTKLSECCDISLKAYLGLLYLNNSLDMYIGVKENQLEQIVSQPFLNTIDKLQSGKKIVEITKSLDFSDECSVVEVYWYPDHAAQGDSFASKLGMGFLLNGILIYHQNRLVSRYDVKLGKILDVLECHPNFGSVFGFIEVKPEYSGNLYSTDMLYPNVLEKYLGRLMFVNQFMETKCKQKRTRPKGDEGNTYQRISKRSKNE